jgi:hypothetical protein
MGVSGMGGAGMGDEDPDVRLARHDERIKQLERALDGYSARLWAALLIAVGAALNAVSDILMRGGGQ